MGDLPEHLRAFAWRRFKIPILTANHFYGHRRFMKTTVELPDDLMRSVKIQAAKENRRLKDLLAEVIARGLAARTAAATGRRAPRPVKLAGGPLTSEDIERDIALGRD